MPGFEGAQPVDNDSVKDGMMCVHCDYLLREPLQTDEGVRVCKSCAQEIEKRPQKTCSECGTTVELNSCYPDKAAQRDILRINVYCKYSTMGCDWQGLLKVWETHCADCLFKGVVCPHSGCQEMVAVRHLEGHKLVCGYRMDKCSRCQTEMQHTKLAAHDEVCEEGVVKCSNEGCGLEMKRKELSHHKRKECKVEECLVCHKQVDRQTGVELNGSHDNKHKQASKQSKHISSPYNTFRHFQTIAETQHNLGDQIKDLQSTIEGFTRGHGAASTHQMMERFDVLTQQVSSLEEALEKMKAGLLPGNSRQPVAVADKNVLSRLKHLEDALAGKDAVIQKQGLEIQELRRMVDKLQATCDKNSRLLRQKRAEGEGTWTAGKEGNYGNSVAMEPRLLQLESRVEELTRQSSSTQVHVQELELQLQASLASTHNGAFLWRIPNISRRKRDAVEERITSIYSPPFYTGRNGYKMCVRAYLNGDGSGYNTHVSLFFVIMKGEFDNLLRWPFDYKVSMILVDQNHRKHIVQTFKPTSESSSFQKPVSEMNVASGCPQFSKLSVFDDDNYCKDDVMFIKCIVDTTKIFHP